MKLKLSSLFFLIIPAITNAQKLPSVQTAGFRAPQNVKIDGAAGDWDNSFQAHNSAVDLLYTIANDDDNLYLLARATDQDIVNRVTNGGVSLAIYKSGKKNDKDKIVITYPLSGTTGYMYFNFRGRKGSIPDTSRRALDSVMITSNKKLDKNVKYIGTTGIAGLDSTISVYNENGIKAAGRFNLQKEYTLEVAIPLKLLGLSAEKATKFTYNLIVNGSASMRNITMGPLMNMDGTPATGKMAEDFAAGIAKVQAQMSASTDCWGEYTLAKRP